MSTWIIEPHDPLIFRDGRPFGPTPGATARTLPFPFPSTTAGGIRSLVGLNDDGMFALDTKQANRLKELSVRGPLLVRLAQGSHDIDGWFAPAPLDALVMKANEMDDSQFTCQQLLPLLPPEGTQSDFTSANHTSKRPVGMKDLLLVGQRKGGLVPGEGKAATNAPPFWHWDFFMQWLEHPDAIEQEGKAEEAIAKNIPAEEIGIGSLPQDLRVHVGMDSENRKSHYGALFDTSGLEFTAVGEQAQRLSHASRLALAIDLDESQQQKLLQGLLNNDVGARERLGSFGGERRIVRWRKSTQGLPPCPDTLKEAISKQGACRLILLTPAYFEYYAYPTWLLEKRLDVEIAPTLKAVAIQRPQIVSGWDMANSRPRKTKRLAPAGTVLYLKFADDLRDTPQLQTWIDETWMHSVSDDDNDKEENPDPQQFRFDGFGLAALGTWSGQPAPMKESEQA